VRNDCRRDHEGIDDVPRSVLHPGGPELPEVALAPEVEGRGKAVVRLLESDDLESPDVIYALKFARGTGPRWRFGHRLRPFSR